MAAAPSQPPAPARRQVTIIEPPRATNRVTFEDEPVKPRDLEEFESNLALYVRLGVEKERLRVAATEARALYEQRRSELLESERKRHLEQLEDAFLQYRRLQKTTEALGSVLLQSKYAERANEHGAEDALGMCQQSKPKPPPRKHLDEIFAELRQAHEAVAPQRGIVLPPRPPVPPSVSPPRRESVVVAGSPTREETSPFRRPSAPDTGSPARRTSMPTAAARADVVAQQAPAEEIEDPVVLGTFDLYAKVQSTSRMSARSLLF
jgi:hypothetical protein